MKKIRFRDLYTAECEKPTPRQVCLTEGAEVTGLSETTVKQWANGVQKPNKTALKLLSEHFDCDPEYLFPKDTEL